MFQQKYRLAQGRSVLRSYSLLLSTPLSKAPGACFTKQGPFNPMQVFALEMSVDSSLPKAKTNNLSQAKGNPPSSNPPEARGTKVDNSSEKNFVKTKQTLGIFSPKIINYKNIGILKNLINLEGKILSRRITCLQSKKQRQTAKAIKSSRVLGLLPFVHKAAPSQRKLRKKIIRYKPRYKPRGRGSLFIRSKRNTRRV